MIMQDGIRKCRRCSSTKCTLRYKLSVDAIDIEPSNEERTTTGRFMFYGNDAGTVIDKDISLLHAQSKSRHNFTPPAITAAVGKKCIVSAVVRDETYDVEEEDLIMFEVKKVELITESHTAETSTAEPNTPPNNTLLTPSESTFNTEITPVEDIIDQTDFQTDNTSPIQVNTGKRKAQNSTASD